LPEHGACCLGSLNLSEFVSNKEFDYFEFRKAVRIAVGGLNEVLDEGLGLHALQEQRDMARDYRNIGLGYMGIGDMFIKMKIAYGSKESKQILDDIGSVMFREAVLASRELAVKYKPFPKYEEAVYDSDIIKDHFTESEIEWLKEGGIRNCSLLSIAPTGSIGTMLDITTGIEPAFAWSYKRKTESLHKEQDVYYTVWTGIAKRYMEENKVDYLPDYFVSSADINWKDRVDIQSIAQKHIDTAISSTVNLPNETTQEEIEQLYLYAWKKKLKGVTIYRDGCKRSGILITDAPKEDVDTSLTLEQLPWGTTLASSHDLIGRKRKLMTGCGSLHCQAFFDPTTGRCMEIFLSKGGSGGCLSMQNSLSRMVSLALRTGADFDVVIDQLKSTTACPSYAIRSATKRDTSKGNACPTAVGNAMIEMQEEIFDLLGVTEEEVYEVHTETKEEHKVETNRKPKCPECDGELRFEGGCQTCMNCAWTKCE